MKNPTFEVNFIVATLNPYSDDLSSMSTCSIPAHITQKTNNDRINLTVEDQQALLNENWDDFNMEPAHLTNKNRQTQMKASFKKFLTKVEQNNRNNNQNEQVFSTAKEDSGENEDEHINLNGGCDILDVIQPSPESPKTKKAKLIFGRCFESTFSKNCLGEVLAPNSDSE